MTSEFVTGLQVWGQSETTRLAERRERIATAVLTGLVTPDTVTAYRTDGGTEKFVAGVYDASAVAVLVADALIAELDK